MIYHAVIGKLNNNDAILGFEGFHSRKKLVRMYKEYIMEEFSTDDKKIEVSYILSSNTPIKCKEMVEMYDS
jgi:hypothetical protein